MNADVDPKLDDEFTARLLACDEAFATGNAPTGPVAGVSPELQARLERGLACVQRLQQLRPQLRINGAANGAPPCPPRIGRFEIRCPLGRGGFGMVYRAYDPMLCREVALKVPRADALADADCQARFQREARAAAGLSHPNLVPVHEAGQVGPVSYIAFAYCPGSDLAAWLKQRTSPVRGAEAARLACILARAVHYAHESGILHRDLKPSNILLSPVASITSAPRDNVWQPDPGELLIPRVTDFGLAKFSVGEQSQTRTGDMLGTPGYMAPEQIDGRLGTAGPPTDVYSLGVILFEVLTGRPPFWGESPIATLMQVKSMEPVSPRRLRPELPRDLETICLKCLHKEPRRRYASAAALADDLERFLAGKPIQARPTSRAEQVLKWTRRHPALSLTLAALLLVTVVGTSGILWQWLQTQGALAAVVVQHIQAVRAQRAEARERERSEVALYHHSVVLAHHEWLAGNVGRSAQLLDECRKDLRDWEWRYVRRLCDSAVLTCPGHSAHITSVAYSPDGRHIASATGLWFTSDPGEVKVWDAETGAPLWTGLGHAAPVMSVAFRPGGAQLVSASATWGATRADIKIWDVATGKVLAAVPTPMGVFNVAYSPDGSRLAAACGDGRIRLWDADSRQLLFVLEGHTSMAFGVAFSPDGRRLASAAREGVAIVWDLERRRPIHHLRGPHDLRSVAFSPDGQRLVAASFDHSVKIWDTGSGQLVRTYWGHRTPVLCAAFAPDGRRVASTDFAGTVHLWDAETGRLFRRVRGHTGSINSAAYSPDGRRLATGGRDQTVRLWDITRDQDVASLPQAAGAMNLAFNPSSQLLAASGYSHSGGAEKRVRIWSMNDSDGPRYWSGHAGWVRCVAFNPAGNLLASGSADRTIRLWDVATAKTVGVLRKHTDMVMAVAFPRDGTRLASASLDKTVQLWDVAARKPLGSPFVHPAPVHDVAFAPDGKRLAAVGEGGMAIVWDAATGAKLFDLPGHRDLVERVVFSPDGHWLATAGADKTVRIWDMSAEPDNQTPVEPAHVLAGHADRVSALSFDPGSHRLASAGEQTIRIWDVGSGDDTLTLRGHADTVCAVAFSPDGRLLISAGTRDIKVWDAGNLATAPISPARAQREAIAWHLQEAQAAQWVTPPQWFGVAFHLSRLLDIQPDRAVWLSWRANADIELGWWQQAAEDATRSIARGATDYGTQYHQVLACLELGDADAYRCCCAAMLDRFGPDRPSLGILTPFVDALQKQPPADRARALEANRTVWICVLGPDGVADPDRVVRAARVAVGVEPKNPAYKVSLGAALYRAGQFQATCDTLSPVLPSNTPEQWLFLAMAHHRLGHPADASRWFDRATNWIETAVRTARTPDAPPDFNGSRHAQVDLLRREAAAVLAGKEGIP